MSEEKLLEETDSLFDAALFELAYEKQVVLLRSFMWSKPITTDDDEDESESSSAEYPTIPPVYNIDLTRFYIRGCTSDPYIQFLSFYHVAEHFFLIVSDGALYKKMSSIINDRKFKSNKPYLDKLIQSAGDHKAESKEEEMLKSVMIEFLDEDELIAEIARIERDAGQKIYTSKTSCFGYDLEKITLQKSHLFGPLSKRIKTIRNALVHSSDRHERKNRYVPGAEANQILKREIPLMKYMAERIIIRDSTARP